MNPSTVPLTATLPSAERSAQRTSLSLSKKSWRGTLLIPLGRSCHTYRIEKYQEGGGCSGGEIKLPYTLAVVSHEPVRRRSSDTFRDEIASSCAYTVSCTRLYEIEYECLVYQETLKHKIIKHLQLFTYILLSQLPIKRFFSSELSAQLDRASWDTFIERTCFF